MLLLFLLGLVVVEGALTERLIVLFTEKTTGVTSDVSTIMHEIRRRLPQSNWNEGRVRDELLTIRARFEMPKWNHDFLQQLVMKNKVSQPALTERQLSALAAWGRTIAYRPYMDIEFTRSVCVSWVTHCILPLLNRRGVPPCYDLEDRWVLSPARISALLTELIMVEESRQSTPPAEIPTSKSFDEYADDFTFIPDDVSLKPDF